jgi:hypothetical protein
MEVRKNRDVQFSHRQGNSTKLRKRSRRPRRRDRRSRNDLHLGHRFDLKNTIDTANSLCVGFRLHPAFNCSWLTSLSIRWALSFALARTLVHLTAADNTTNATSMITHTATTKPKITVFDSSRNVVPSKRHEIVTSRERGRSPERAAPKVRKEKAA